MSRTFEARVVCPCENQFDIRIYGSVWLEDSEKMQLVMDEKVNIFPCPACGNEIDADVPFICTNVPKTYAVWYEPHQDGNVDGQIATFRKLFGPDNFYVNAPRVSSFAELKETIQKFEDGTLKGTPVNPADVMAPPTEPAPPPSKPTPEKPKGGLLHKIGTLFQKSPRN